MKVTNCSGTLKGIIETRDNVLTIWTDSERPLSINLLTERADISMWCSELSFENTKIITLRSGNSPRSYVYAKCIELEAC